MVKLVRRAPLTELALPQQPLLQQLYRQRGVATLEQLDYRLSNLPAPAALRGIEQAVARLAAALSGDQQLLIVGDFDADGATSTALMVLALRAFGYRVEFLVPDRFKLGYGLSPAIVELAAAQCAPALIITVDNGIASVDGVARASQLGIEVIVTDHHLPGPELPAAAAIVNPNQPGCDFPSKAIAGVGVAFYLLLALRAELRDRGHFDHCAEPNLAQWLDLVALGSVADVVPLDTLNRLLIDQGLRRIRAGRCRPGIAALLQLAGRQTAQLQASDLGFAVAPRLNAAGRLDNMRVGIECLLAEQPQQALALAEQLDALNRERRAIEQGMQDEALQQLEAAIAELDGAALPALLVLYRRDWHEGVVGLLASRVKERFHRPTIVFTDSESGDLKGSARSIEGLHIRDLLDQLATAHPGLISKFGGHAMAAGLTLAAGQLAAFETQAVALASAKLTAEQLQAVQFSDGELSSEQLTVAVADTLRAAGPWGQQFPPPQFDGQFQLLSQRVVGERHLKMVLRPLSGEQHVEAIWFNPPSHCLDGALPLQLQLLYRLEINDYRGRRSLQLVVEQLLGADD